MLKIVLILLFSNLILSAKYLVTTYFPLETTLLNKIGQKEFKIKEIKTVYNSEFNKLAPTDIEKFANVKVYFHLGLDIEKEYAKILKEYNSELLIVDLSENIKKVDNNPYIWTDPLLLREIAQNMYNNLVLIDGINKDYYKTNYEAFLNELDDMFLRIKQKIDTSPTSSLYVFDDYWFYFAQRFRLNLIKREKRFISAKEVIELIKFSEENSVNKLLISKRESTDIVKSMISNTKITTIEDDIFDELLFVNLVSLASNISK